MLNTRVTLGISFSPFTTSGSAAISFACSLPLVALKIASVIGARCPLSTTLLIGTRLVSLFRLGTTNVVWNVPMCPVASSRASTLMVYLPGNRVSPVEYATGLLANCSAVLSLSFAGIKSRRFVTVVPP